MSIVVRGHNAFDAIPYWRSSAASPMATRLMENFEMVYAVVVRWNHLGSKVIGGDNVRMWGLSASLSAPIADVDSENEPRALMSCIRS
ncbi:Uncharacterised protein [Mycobacteroides abscessus subsp. abscessus]|nr:Uncharacterised protein [Mycobacteroides abscessus subsp. abscessus]